MSERATPQPSASPPRLPHLAGLDGLRALAVAGVVLYHAGVGWLPGGFLGVDVFFVLSGYLITSLLLAEHRASGRIALGRFWLRRARRLLPAAVTLIGVCLLVVAALFPGELARARGDALASLLYVNNWHQLVAGHSYFAAFETPSPFRHLWSLAVEEQFYLLWPPALSAGLVLLGRRRTALALPVAIAASAGAMALLYDPTGDPSRVYYGTDTRAAPLLIGALLAFAWAPDRLTARTGRGAGRLLDGVAVAAVGVLALAMLGWRDYDPLLYRGGLAVVALAAAALVAMIAHPACAAGRVLGARPLRWVGERSYGIYLWHWPVMVLVRPDALPGLARTPLVLAQIGLTVAIAALSFRFVEQPFRRGEAQRRIAGWMDRRRPRERLAVAGAAAAALVLVWVGALVRPVPVRAGERLVSAASTAAAAQAPGPAPAASGGADSGAGAAAAPVGGEPPLAVGASVMLASAHALERRLGRRAHVDAAVGRQVDDVIRRLDAYRRAGRLPSRVIVQVGENGPLWSADLARLRAALRGVARVVLVTVRVPRSWEAESNAALSRLAATWPAARIADWHAASADETLLFDGAHPNPAGQRVYARVVARALRG